MVKLMGGLATRNFRNDHHPEIVESDYNGARVMLGNRYKLIMHNGNRGGEPIVELFDLRADPGETSNLYAEDSELARRYHGMLVEQLRASRAIAAALGRKPSPEGPELDRDAVDEDVLDNLRALGYIE